MCVKNGRQKYYLVIFICTFWVSQILATATHKCVKNGLYEHPTDCDKFYSCAPIGPVLMHCPAGLHFNPQHMICDWPQEAGCIGKEIADSGNTPSQSCPIYPYPKDCTKFYLCLSSGTALVHCPKGLYFNPQLLLCDWPRNVKCTETRISTTSYPVTSTKKTPIKPTSVSSANNNEIFSDGTSTLGISEKAKLTSTHQPYTTSDIGYMTNILNSTVLCERSIWPHPNECNKFFMCGSTGAVEKVCPEKLLFNSVLLVCDWPYNVMCKVALNATTEMTTAERIEKMSSTTFTTANFSDTNTTEHSFISTIDSEDFETTTIENVSEITTDNRLSVGEQTETTITTEENTTIEYTNIHIHSPETTLFSTTAEAITISQSIDSIELCQGAIWPHPNDCTKFYMCSSTGAVEMLCPKQLHFNPVLLVCDWPYEAGCQVMVNMITDFTTVKPNEYASTTTVAISFSETVSTEYSFESTNGTEYIETENILFTNSISNTTLTVGENTTIEPNSITTQTLDTSFDSTTFQSTDSGELCKGSIWPHPEDCTKYILCGSTGPVEMICPKELNFNPALLVCDWPLNVKCKEYLNASSEIITTEYISVSTEHFETTTTEELDKKTTENRFSTDEITTTKGNSTEEFTSITSQSPTTTLVGSTTEFTASFQSTDGTEYCTSSIWPHPDDCIKYFMCSDTGAVEMVCSEKLHFHPLLLVCDWPVNVQCLNASPEITTTDILVDPPAITITTASFLETETAKIVKSTVGTVHSQMTTIENFDKITTENILSSDKYIETTKAAEENSTKEFTSITTENPETTFVSTATKSTTNYWSTESTILCEGSIWPHPDDCTKFFICGSIGALEMLCPDQTHFNSVLLVCSSLNNDECKNSSNMTFEITTAYALPEYEINTSNILGPDATSNITNNLLEIVTLDQRQSTSIEYLETSTEKSSNNSSAENLLISTAKDETKKPMTSTTQMLETTVTSTSEPKPIYSSTKSTKLCEGPIWSHPNDCQKFFVCDSDKPVEMDCPEQLHFNPVLLICDWPHHAGCTITLEFRLRQ